MNWPGPSWKAPKKEPVDGDTSAIFTFWGNVCPPSCDAKIHSSSVIGTAKVQFGSSALYPSSWPGGGGIGFAWLQVLPPSVDFATPTSSEKELKSRTRFE